MKKRKNKIRFAAIAIIWSIMILFMFSSCGENRDSSSDVVKAGEDEYILYYVSIDSTQLVPVCEKMDKTRSVKEQVSDILNTLIKVNDSIEYKTVLPDKVKLQSYEVKENKTVTLDFSSSYYDAIASTQVLCRAAFVKSLTQIKGIESVDFTVDGQVMMEEKNAVPAMNGDSFIDNDSRNDINQVQNVTIYYTNVTGDLLEPISIPINLGTNVSAEQLVIEQLIKGTDEKGYYDTLPEGTKLLSVSTKDGVCYVDFSKEFMKLGNKVKDQTVIYSVVNSLCELPTVSKVSFTIEGSQERLYNGNIPFDQLFERNLDIVDK